MHGTELMAQCQLPITLERSEPEPDLAVVHRSVAADRHPGLDEIVVAIEVANSSSRFDLTTKARIYAQAGIPTVEINPGHTDLSGLVSLKVTDRAARALDAAWAALSTGG